MQRLSSAQPTCDTELRALLPPSSSFAFSSSMPSNASKPAKVLAMRVATGGGLALPWLPEPSWSCCSLLQDTELNSQELLRLQARWRCSRHWSCPRSLACVCKWCAR